MQHLHEDRLIEIARGGGSPEEHRHLASCRACTRAVRLWRKRLEGMGELAAAALSDGERHRLRVLFRQLGPGRRESWVARLVRRAPRPAPALRGQSVASLEDLEAGPYRGLLQVRPSGDGTFELHLMVRRGGEAAPAGSRFVLSGPGARAHVALLDEHGEVHVGGLEPGRYSAVCWLPEGRMELPEIRVGGGDGD